MSKRKFSAPGHRSWNFLIRKRRTRNHSEKLKSFQKDNSTKLVHLIAFPRFKADMSQIV